MQELADVSIACRAPITTANFSINGYLWTVQYNKIGKERRDVFIKKSDNEVGQYWLEKVVVLDKIII